MQKSLIAYIVITPLNACYNLGHVLFYCWMEVAKMLQHFVKKKEYWKLNLEFKFLRMSATLEDINRWYTLANPIEQQA